MQKEICEIHGRFCYIYGKKNPGYLLIQPVNEPHVQMLDQQIRFMEAQTEKSFLFVAFVVKKWNQDLSPWCAPAVFGKEDFGNGAEETLLFIEKELIPEIRVKFGLEENIPVISGGYSLAGLFALWSVCRTDRLPPFAATAAVSPSVWFPGWADYRKKNPVRTEHVYLSLGDREEKTRNKVMAQVGTRIKEEYHRIVKKENTDCILEWNEGNHFRDVDVRCGKGFLWCMESLKTEEKDAKI